MAQGNGTHAAPNPPRGQWHVTVARALGRATRATAQEIEIFRRNMARARDSFLPETAPRRRPLSPLLEKLGEVVTRHADQGFVTLRDDPVFWALIRHIHSSRPLPRTKPTRRRSAKRVGKQITPAADRRADDESAGHAAAGVESVVDAVAEVDAAADATDGVESVLDAVAEVDAAADATDGVESVLDAVAEVDAAGDATDGDEAPVDEPESGKPGSGGTVDDEGTKEQSQ